MRKDLIEIPKELIMKHHNIKLCMDAMYVNEYSLLPTIFWTIKYQSLVPIELRNHEEYFPALNKDKYNNAPRDT